MVLVGFASALVMRHRVFIRKRHLTPAISCCPALPRHRCVAFSLAALLVMFPAGSCSGSGLGVVPALSFCGVHRSRGGRAAFGGAVLLFAVARRGCLASHWAVNIAFRDEHTGNLGWGAS